MAKPHDPVSDHRWGTWEELLLACAVNRHGTKSWDSVAMEVQRRISSPLLLTANNCRQKYHDLQRRFMAVDQKSNGGDDDSKKHDEKTIPWLEELRKLRVAELRRDVERSDLSIESLQQKVKKLKEERERSLKEKGNDEEKSDLEKDSRKIRETERDGESEKSLPGNDVEKRIFADESDRSFNESNSTGPKGKNGETKTEPDRKLPETAETGAGKPDPISGKPVGGEGSYNGSSDTTAKAAAPIPVPEAGESAEFRESVAESKGAKESSDVQSSASLSRRRRRKEAASGFSSGEEPEADGVSPAMKRSSVKSQRMDRLVRFLDVIRSHKHGSVFERRLESQESVDYQNLIRQHLDLEMVKAKLEEGLYSNNNSLDFFRDLLLLFNNALVFFPKNSTESIAATELREIVSKEMTRSRSIPISIQIHNQNPPSKKPTPPLQSNPTPAISLPSKPNPSRPIIACRKRSSISAKAQLLETKGNRPGTDIIKPGSDRKEPDDNPSKQQRTRERSASKMRGGRTNKSGNRSLGGQNSNSVAKAGLLNDDPPEKKSETPIVKKQSAASFLNRMKRTGTLLDTLKESSVNNNSSSNGRGRGESSNSRGRGEQKKGGRGGDVRRDQGGVRQGSVGKQVEVKEQEQRIPAKRSVGRPPKRVAPPKPLPTPPPPSRKPPRKRGRR